MSTLVGTQTDFNKVLQELAELDFDAVEAYKTAIEKLENVEYKTKLLEFQHDHEEHIAKINHMLGAHGFDIVTDPSMKRLLTKGKVALADLIGDDNTILKAMLDNELDTNTAYERAGSHPDKWADAVEVLSQGLLDEQKHKNWLEKTIK